MGRSEINLLACETELMFVNLIVFNKIKAFELYSFKQMNSAIWL